MKKINAIPDGYHTLTPYLIVRNAAAALTFYKKAFGATEIMRVDDPKGGKVGHAEIKIGDSIIMMADEYPEMNCVSAQTLKGSPVHLHLYVEDVDNFSKQAIAAGAKILMPVEDKFYGDRSGSLEDPFGHIWHVATHKEDLSIEEIKERAQKACG